MPHLTFGPGCKAVNIILMIPLFILNWRKFPEKAGANSPCGSVRDKKAEFRSVPLSAGKFASMLNLMKM